MVSDLTAERLRRVAFLGRNPLTLFGAALTSSTALTMIGGWLLELLGGGHAHPYVGILLFLVLPALFVVGLVLMPLGLTLRRRKLAATGSLPSEYPPLGSQPAVRQMVQVFLALSAINVALIATASYRGVSYMDSTQFCGLTCHTVMAPEYSAYLNSPHSRVACSECHIGEGASWFVRSKLSGTRQLFAVAFKTYSRPIPSPVRHLRPARETCEQCHWPQKFHGDKVKVVRKFAEDEANTPSTTVLVLKVGGQRTDGGIGIHGRHLSDKSRITYVTTDGQRQAISAVTYVGDDGKVAEFAAEAADPPASAAASERREMDCVDCHNRPTHVFELPDRALDRALQDGRISPSLPFVKKKGMELLKADYPDGVTASARIASGLVEYYKTEQPAMYAEHKALVETAAQHMAAIYSRNVFPEMKVTWGTHPNNIGHTDSLGCFRCHDEQHKTKDGRTITQDCAACHTILAMDEANPKVLADLGLE